MKTFLQQVVDNDRDINDLENAIGEFSLGVSGANNLGDYLGLTDEEYVKWMTDFCKRGKMHPAIEDLKVLLDKKIESGELKPSEEIEKASERSLLKIKQAQVSIAVARNKL
jgi:hypothetical protein